MFRAAWWLLVALSLVAPACAREEGPVLLAVSLPDLSPMDPSVQDQVRARYAALEQVRERGDEAPAAERARAYGAVGMLLQAAEAFDAAEPFYRNAEALQPGEPRWPYFRAHLHKSRGEVAEAEAAFERVLALRPDETAALIWLGRLHLDQGEAAEALPLFDRAQRLAPRSVAALAGLGQAALAQKDFARAVQVLDEALAIDPSAASIHSPLAMAHRGLGNLEAAERHLPLWKNTEILLVDPMRQELDLALDSGLSYELRGVRALEARDFVSAAAFFEKGVALTRADSALGRSLRHKLGTARYMTGDVRAAVARFREVVAAAPEEGQDETAAKAHYSLGVLMATAGRGGDAIDHFEAAVRYSPNYVEARQALGDALRRADRPREALAQYDGILEMAPQSADARLGAALALAGLGRWGEARQRLEAARQQHPDRQDVALLLARLLAAAPDAAARDGRRAMQLVDELLAGARTVELGETTAMALAETGRHAEAAAVQQQVMKAAQDAGLDVNRPLMERRLALYTAGRPARAPWTPDETVAAAGPPVDDAIAQALR